MLHKISKRKTLKISYSCTNNFLKIINTHNLEVIRKYYDQLDVNNNNNNSKWNYQIKTRLECLEKGKHTNSWASSNKWKFIKNSKRISQEN